MSRADRFVRRNRVDERYAIAIAVAGGVVVALAGAQPTGMVVWDIILTFTAVAAVVWASASAPWWAPAAAVGVGAVVALDLVIAAIGAVGFVVGLSVGLKRRDQSEIRALTAAIAMNVLIRSDLEGFLGLSALIGIGVGLMVFVLGVRRRPSQLRRIAWIASGSLAGFLVLALGALAIAGVSARPDLTQGVNSANRAIDVLNEGDYQQAAELFQTSAEAFGRADDRLGGLLASPSRLVPGVSQNVGVGGDLAAVAASGTNDAAQALRAIDPSKLRVIDGSIDVAAIAAVQAPLEQVQGSLDDIEAVSSGADSPWLVGRLQSELDDLERRVGENQPRLANAIDAVRLSPRMLGADGLRRYLVMFTTPVEARGIAGFMGNYAEITIDNGRIDVTEFGRNAELADVIRADGATCDGASQEFLDRYGRFGCTAGPDGGVIPTVWSNLTMPAHFPSVAEAASILYPQSGGKPVDGVLSLDPHVVGALMGYTGPIDVPELGVTVTPDDAVQFIQLDQYVLAGDDANEQRVDALQTLGEGVIAALLTGALPEPSQLARDLGPLASEHRLMMWAADPDERELLERTKLLGGMPALGSAGGFSVVVANKGESKIDVFLERDVDVRIVTGEGGTRTLVADVTLTNNAPSSGLPRYVIGNNYDLPSGSSWLIVNFFGPPTLQVVTRDGEDIAVGTQPEAGWMGYATDVVIGPGESVEYHLEFDLPAGDGGEVPVEWMQPLADRPT